MKKNNFISILLALSILLVYEMFELIGTDEQAFGEFFVIFTLLNLIVLIYKNRQHKIVLIMLVFLSLYFIYMIPYYYYGIHYHIYTQYQTVELTNRVLIYQLMFLNVIFFSPGRNLTDVLKRITVQRNDLIFYTNLVVIASILILTFHPSRMVFFEEYSIDGYSSSLWEYALIFILVAFRYASSVSKRIILLVLVLTLASLPILYGRRLPTLMILLMLYILFFYDDFKPKMVMFLSVMFFVFIRFLGDIRNTISGDVGLLASLMSLSAEGIMQNNQGGVMLCSVSYLGLIDDGIFDVEFQIYSAVGQILSIFLPVSMNIEEAYINLYALNYTSIPGNGGLSSVYLYLWGGVPLIILGGIILKKIIYIDSHRTIVILFSVFVLATFPRWAAYNMNIIIKLGFWFVAIYIFFYLISRLMKRQD